MKKFLVVLMFAMVATGCMHVDAGHVGVEVDECGNGGVKETPVGVGYHSVGACTSVIEFPTFQQTAAFKDAEALSLNDSMGLPIQADVVLNFTVDPAMAPKIYSKFRKDLDSLKISYFRQVVYESMKDVYEDYTAQQLYSGKQETARAAIESLLIDKLSKEGFIVTQFTVNKVTVPEEVVAAIRAKSTMTESAERAELEKRKVQAETELVKEQARGVAAAIREKADAEAYANQKIADSLSPTLVEYMRVQKWNGQMAPVTNVTGGAVVTGGQK